MVAELPLAAKAGIVIFNFCRCKEAIAVFLLEERTLGVAEALYVK